MAKSRPTRPRRAPRVTEPTPERPRRGTPALELRTLAGDVRALADRLEAFSEVATQPRMIDIVRGILRALGVLIERGAHLLNCMQLQAAIERIDGELSRPGLTPERRKELNELGEILWETHARTC